MLCDGGSSSSRSNGGSDISSEKVSRNKAEPMLV